MSVLVVPINKFLDDEKMWKQFPQAGKLIEKGTFTEECSQINKTEWHLDQACQNGVVGVIEFENIILSNLQSNPLQNEGNLQMASFKNVQFAQQYHKCQIKNCKNLFEITFEKCSGKIILSQLNIEKITLIGCDVDVFELDETSVKQIIKQDTVNSQIVFFQNNEKVPYGQNQTKIEQQYVDEIKKIALVQTKMFEEMNRLNAERDESDRKQQIEREQQYDKVYGR